MEAKYVTHSHELQEKLHELRLMNGLTMSEAAKGIGASRQHIMNIEHRVYQAINPEVLAPLAEVYHVDVDDLENPDKTSIDILPEEYYLPNIEPIVRDKTENQKMREEEIYNSIPFPDARLKAVINLYNLPRTQVAEAIRTSPNNLTAATSGTSSNAELIYFKAAKVLGLDPLYFNQPFEERKARRAERAAKSRAGVEYNMPLSRIVPIEKNEEERKLEAVILQIPSLAERYSRLKSLYRLSTDEIARRTGLAPLTLKRILREGRTSNDSRQRLALFFDVNPNALLDSNTAIPKPKPTVVQVPSIDTAVNEILLNLQSDSIPVLASQFLIEAGRLFTDPEFTEADKTAFLKELTIFYKGAHI